MTSKKIEKHLNRIWFHYMRLQDALNKAHRDKLIDYEVQNFSEAAPCAAMEELKIRIEATTKDQIADTVQKEIRRKHWW